MSYSDGGVLLFRPQGRTVLIQDLFYFNSSGDAYESYQNRGDYRIAYPVNLYGGVARIGGPAPAPPNNPTWLVSADGVMGGFCASGNNTFLLWDVLTPSYTIVTTVTIPNPAHDAGLMVRGGVDNQSGYVFDLDTGGNVILYSMTGGATTSVTSTALAVTANRTYRLTASVTPAGMVFTAVDLVNGNTATIASSASLYTTNSRVGLFVGGAVGGTVNFGPVTIYGQKPTPPVPPPLSLLSVSDTFTDSNGVSVTAHTISPTNLAAAVWNQVIAGAGSDVNDYHNIQSNALRLGGSRDLGNDCYLNSVKGADGLLLQVDGTFDPTNGSSFGVSPQINMQNPYSFSTPNVVCELTTFPPNTGFSSLPNLARGQLLVILQPGTQPISSQTVGGVAETVHCIARTFFPMALGSSWREQTYIFPDPANPGGPWYLQAYATPLSGGNPSGPATLLASVRLLQPTALKQYAAWTGVLLMKGGDAPTGVAVNLTLDNFQAWVRPQSGGVLDFFNASDGTNLVGRTPSPTNDVGGTWAKLLGAAVVAQIQSNKLRFTNAGAGEDTFWGLVSGLTGGTFGCVLQTPTTAVVGGPCFGFDATGQNGYFLTLSWTGGQVFCQKMVSGVKSTLAGGTLSLGGALAANTDYVLEAFVSGTTLQVFFGGALIGTVTLPTGITTNTYAGMYAGINTGNTLNVDNFYCHA